MPLTIMINSNLGRISHRFRDMASFPLKTYSFSIHRQFNTGFETVPLGVNLDG